MSKFHNCNLNEDKRGITVSSGSVTISKNDANLIGLTLGGGAHLCPCVYVVHVVENGAVCKDGTLKPGDEIVAVNGVSVKGMKPTVLANVIRGSGREVLIYYNKLHCDLERGRSLEIKMISFKHALVDLISSKVAGEFNISHALLKKDIVAEVMTELRGIKAEFGGVFRHLQLVLKKHAAKGELDKKIGDVFAEMATRESSNRRSYSAFTSFSQLHREMAQHASHLAQTCQPIIGSMKTFLTKIIPDMQRSIQKYALAKFEYLSFCLKIMEMDEEVVEAAAEGRRLERMRSGNYEYRMLLRCRYLAQQHFARVKSDVVEKMGMLNLKRQMEIATQMIKLATNLSDSCDADLQLQFTLDSRLPIEVDLTEAVNRANAPKNQNWSGVPSAKDESSDDECLLGQ